MQGQQTPIRFQDLKTLLRAREIVIQLDNDKLDAAISLMPFMYRLFKRLKKKERSILLQILVKRIIVDPHGEIVNHELNSPFAYLRSIVDQFQILNSNPRGSEHVQVPPPS